MLARYQWRPYVSVAKRSTRSARYVLTMRGQGEDVQPVVIDGRQIAHTFWGQAWCDHLERFSDYENRLPRGRTYVRNGSVCHLEIAAGEVQAVVIGSDLYDVTIGIDPLPAQQWHDLRGRCAGQIGSLLELLQGRLSDRVMAEVCDPDRGLFPRPPQIHMACSCPDWAVMCKHVAAVLYGVGARLDEQPQLLFVLRGVGHEELLGAAPGLAVTTAAGTGRRRIAEQDLGDVFGIELSPDTAAINARPGRQRRVASKTGATPKARTATRRASSGQRHATVPRSTGRTGGGDEVVVAPTGQDVARVRARFNMSQEEFGLLLDVSAVSVSNWERRPGALRLQRRTKTVWPDVSQLTAEEAWICLELLSRSDV